MLPYLKQFTLELVILVKPSNIIIILLKKKKKKLIKLLTLLKIHAYKKTNDPPSWLTKQPGGV